MRNDNTEVSIILLTYNGAQYLKEVLISIFAQRTKYNFEVIAIDSGSKDESLAILKQFPVKVHEIPNSDFGHGKTRNLGRELSQGDYMVFLTQDATPANERWLENLVNTVAQDDKIAGVYSRHLPRPDCNPCERRDIQEGLPPYSIVKKVDFTDRLQKEAYERSVQTFILFSDVCSCVRKTIHKQLPFNEEILMMEDQEWCKRVLEAGHTVVYDGSSVVYHSHNFPPRNIFKRGFEYGVSFGKIVNFKMPFSNVLSYIFTQSCFDFFFIVGQKKPLFWKFFWIAKAPLVRFAMRYGLYKGLKA